MLSVRFFSEEIIKFTPYLFSISIIHEIQSCTYKFLYVHDWIFTELCIYLSPRTCAVDGDGDAGLGEGFHVAHDVEGGAYDIKGK